MKLRIMLLLMTFSIVNVCCMAKSPSKVNSLQEFLSSMKREKKILNECSLEIQRINEALQASHSSAELEQLTAKQAEREAIDNRIKMLCQQAREVGVYAELEVQFRMSESADGLSQSTRDHARLHRKQSAKKSSCWKCCKKE